MTPSKPNHLPRPHLLIPSHWSLGLQHVDLGRTQSIAGYTKTLSLVDLHSYRRRETSLLLSPQISSAWLKIMFGSSSQDLSVESGRWVSGNWPWTFTSISLPPQATSSLRAKWTASTTPHLQPRRSLCLQIAEHSHPLVPCRRLARLGLFPRVLGWNFYLCWTMNLGLTDTTTVYKADNQQGPTV